jgi:FtsH-binding integral membrane protein
MSVRRFLHRWTAALTAMLVPLALASTAALAAPGAGSAAPPAPTLRNAAHPAIGFIVIFLLLVAVIAVSLMPSKRSHQD